MSKKTSLINGLSLAFGIAGAVCVFISRVLSGSPLDMIHKLEGIDVLPPIWIFNLLSAAWGFLICAALGAVIKRINDGGGFGQSEMHSYRGIAFFLVTFFMGLLWYPVFFAAQAIVIALLISLVTTVFAVCSAYDWFCAENNSPAVIMSAYSIWSIYILIINFSVLLQI